MPRPRKNKAQRTIDDLVLEDPELAAALQDVTDLEKSAKDYRTARQTVKSLIVTNHPELINAVLEDGSPRFCVVDGHRFSYQTSEVPAGTVPKLAPARTSTHLDIHAMEPS